jgi:hypothetical protein
MKSMVLIVDYFGCQPSWFPLYIETCRWNPTIDWVFNTDCLTVSAPPPNTQFRKMSLSSYIDNAAKRLGVQLPSFQPYKLCDLRPMYGLIHSEIIAGYDYYGFTDIDVLYGQIREFYDDAVLSHNTVSTHRWFLSGHLSLFRNSELIRHAFERIPGWIPLLQMTEYQRLDEYHYRDVFRYPRGLDRRQRQEYDTMHPESAKYRRNHYWKEQYTTPLTPSLWHDHTDIHPDEWQWRDGRVTNSSFAGRTYVYLHFMNFKTPRYLHPRYNSVAPWTSLDSIVTTPLPRVPHEITVDRYGIRVS